MKWRVKFRKWAKQNVKEPVCWQWRIISAEFLTTCCDNQTSFGTSECTSKKNLSLFINSISCTRPIGEGCDEICSNSCRNWHFRALRTLQPLKKAWMIIALWFCFLSSCTMKILWAHSHITIAVWYIPVFWFVRSVLFVKGTLVVDVSKRRPSSGRVSFDTRLQN